jgi:methyl-accepting chemotaxis protein
VTEAIQSIAEASQTTSDISGGITNAVYEVTENAASISDMSEGTSNIAAKLNDVVGKFRL